MPLGRHKSIAAATAHGLPDVGANRYGEIALLDMRILQADLEVS
jgi:hypothetical protein